MDDRTICILFLSADPDRARPIHADRELRQIRERIRGSTHRDRIELVERSAVRPGDLLQALYEVDPQVVHISGHGTSEGEIELEGDDGLPHPVPAKALAELFCKSRGRLRVVVLNSCHSLLQAEAIREHIDCAIGMQRAIGSEAAGVFAAAFYLAIGFGRSIRAAFDAGLLELKMNNIPEANTPRLVARAGVDPATVVLVGASSSPGGALERAPGQRAAGPSKPGEGPAPSDSSDAFGPLELVVIIGDSLAVHRLPARGQVVLGRVAAEQGPFVVIDDWSVSRRHAILHLDPPLRIEDLGSANGIVVCDPHETQSGRTHNLRQVSRQDAPIGIGGRICLGTTAIMVRRAAPPPALLAEASAPAPMRDVAFVRHPLMRDIYEQAERAAQARMPINVLCLGEAGVGKDVLARAIHRRSPRAAGPFITHNCATIPDAMIDAELFGYEKGAFPGALEARPGLLERADGGTLFLDEVTELPVSSQAKLLRVFEDRAVKRLGASTVTRVDVRFITATNRDIEAAVTLKAFREDLYHRLNTLTIRIPPLHGRVSEIKPLAMQFLLDACLQMDRSRPPVLSEQALACLEAYRWPGNVRQLRNVIDRAVVLCSADELLPQHLPSEVASSTSIDT